MINFQSESKKTGDEFESLVEQDLIFRDGIIVGKDYCIKELGNELNYIADLPTRIE